MNAQRCAADALRQANHASAADAIEDAAWTIADGEAQIQTELSKVMMPAVINPEAEKIVREALRTAGVVKLILLPGAGTMVSGSKKTRPSRTGSAEEKAKQHPLVQQAQKLFNAEIQTVIDLSGKD